MTRRGLLLLFLAGLCLARTETWAEQKPTARERLRPEGIDGALVLCSGAVSDAARDRFFDLAGKDKARIVVVSPGNDKIDSTNAKKLAEAWRDGKAADVIYWDKGPGKLPEKLREATGVWFAHLEADGLLKSYRDKAVEQELAALLKRGGVVGATDGTALGQSGFALLPGALVKAQFHKDEDEKRLIAALEKSPGVFGVGLDDGAALVVKGRQMALVGDGHAAVLLAKSEGREARTVELSARAPTDLTLWRRCALARAEPAFPAKGPPVPEVPKGSLVIVGGGGMPADVAQKFIELAGGPDALIVVLPTAQPDPVPASEGGFLKRAGAKNVVVLPSRKREEVEDPKNLETLKKAGGVWFGGGRQWRFIDAYEGTKAEEVIRDVLRRGGVIGGSSAGATIQGYYLCRGSPLNNTDILCEGYERGLNFLPGVAIDQHFTQRKRLGDMTALMKAYPQLLGVGLDEATALVVRGHVGEVMGQGQAHFYDRRKPVAEDQADHESVKAGGRYDLKERKVLAEK
jgi:cyanophycinase